MSVSLPGGWDISVCCVCNKRNANPPTGIVHMTVLAYTHSFLMSLKNSLLISLSNIK